MKCLIVQPLYIPWIGYFDLIDKVDTCVFLDHIQLAKNSWQVRNKIKNANGTQWLKTTIEKERHRDELMIHTTRLKDTVAWRQQHLNAIEFNYKNAPHFESFFPLLKKCILTENVTVADFNIQIIRLISELFELSTPILRSSELSGISGSKDALLVSICKELGASEYLTGMAAVEYIERDSPGGLLAQNGIDVFYHQYEHPTYTQCYQGFVPYLSTIDFVFNEGSRFDLIESGRRKDLYFSELPSAVDTRDRDKISA